MPSIENILQKLPYDTEFPIKAGKDKKMLDIYRAFFGGSVTSKARTQREKREELYSLRTDILPPYCHNAEQGEWGWNKIQNAQDWDFLYKANLATFDAETHDFLQIRPILFKGKKVGDEIKGQPTGITDFEGDLWITSPPIIFINRANVQHPHFVFGFDIYRQLVKVEPAMVLLIRKAGIISTARKIIYQKLAT